jgi:hypothetical protein
LSIKALKRIGLVSDAKYVVLQPGEEIVPLSKEEQTRLVNIGAAEWIEHLSGDDVKPPQDMEADDINYYQILEDEFDPAELKEAAKEAGIEFAGNISKKNLINLIIEEDKVKDIIDLEVED